MSNELKIKGHRIKGLILKEWLTDWTNKSAFIGTVIQIISSVFLLYLATPQLQDVLWNALLFVVIIFSISQALSRVYLTESKAKTYFLHAIASPIEIFLSKALYNTLLGIVLSIMCLVIYSVLLGLPVDSIWAFTAVIVLFSASLSVLYTFTSAISAKTQNSSILSIILALPLTVPIILVSISAGKRAMDGIIELSFYKDLGVLGLIFTLIFVLGLVLYPFVWRD